MASSMATGNISSQPIAPTTWSLYGDNSTLGNDTLQVTTTEMLDGWGGNEWSLSTTPLAPWVAAPESHGVVGAVVGVACVVLMVSAILLYTYRQHRNKIAVDLGLFADDDHVSIVRYETPLAGREGGEWRPSDLIHSPTGNVHGQASLAPTVGACDELQVQDIGPADQVEFPGFSNTTGRRLSGGRAFGRWSIASAEGIQCQQPSASGDEEHGSIDPHSTGVITTQPSNQVLRQSKFRAVSVPGSVDSDDNDTHAQPVSRSQSVASATPSFPPRDALQHGMSLLSLSSSHGNPPFFERERRSQLSPVTVSNDVLAAVSSLQGIDTEFYDLIYIDQDSEHVCDLFFSNGRIVFPVGDPCAYLPYHAVVSQLLDPGLMPDCSQLDILSIPASIKVVHNHPPKEQEFLLEQQLMANVAPSQHAKSSTAIVLLHLGCDSHTWTGREVKDDELMQSVDGQPSLIITPATFGSYVVAGVPRNLLGSIVRDGIPARSAPPGRQGAPGTGRGALGSSPGNQGLQPGDGNRYSGRQADGGDGAAGQDGNGLGSQPITENNTKSKKSVRLLLFTGIAPLKDFCGPETEWTMNFHLLLKEDVAGRRKIEEREARQGKYLLANLPSWKAISQDEGIECNFLLERKVQAMYTFDDPGPYSFDLDNIPVPQAIPLICTAKEGFCGQFRNLEFKVYATAAAEPSLGASRSVTVIKSPALTIHYESDQYEVVQSSLLPPRLLVKQRYPVACIQEELGTSSLPSVQQEEGAVAESSSPGPGWRLGDTSFASLDSRHAWRAEFGSSAESSLVVPGSFTSQSSMERHNIVSTAPRHAYAGIYHTASRSSAESLDDSGPAYLIDSNTRQYSRQSSRRSSAGQARPASVTPRQEPAPSEQHGGAARRQAPQRPSSANR